MKCLNYSKEIGEEVGVLEVLYRKQSRSLARRRLRLLVVVEKRGVRLTSAGRCKDWHKGKSCGKALGFVPQQRCCRLAGKATQWSTTETDRKSKSSPAETTRWQPPSDPAGRLRLCVAKAQHCPFPLRHALLLQSPRHQKENRPANQCAQRCSWRRSV